MKENFISIRRKPLSEEEKQEICEKCGHTRGNHHNPYDECFCDFHSGQIL